MRKQSDGQPKKRGQIGDAALLCAQCASESRHGRKKQTQRIGVSLQACAELEALGIREKKTECRKYKHGKDAVAKGKGFIRYPCWQQKGRTECPEKLWHEERTSLIRQGKACRTANTTEMDVRIHRFLLYQLYAAFERARIHFSRGLSGGSDD